MNVTPLPDMIRTAGRPISGPPLLVRRGLLRPLARIRFQLIGGFLFASVTPALLRHRFEFPFTSSGTQNAMVGTALAILGGTYVLRRMLAFPGVQGMSFVLPVFTAAYSLMVFGLFFLRLDYSRFQILASFAFAVAWFILVTLVERHYKRPLLSILPVGDTNRLTQLKEADWLLLQDPQRIPVETSGLVADLRAELSPEWEKLLAASALHGLPVYHSKHVLESLTGRVEIEHLSENSLGSLLPSSIYLRFKHAIDTAGVIVALPVLLPIGLALAVLIKLEDGGPVFFRQPRMGFRGKVFSMVKFRTMRSAVGGGQHFTDPDDPRITRVGRVLRRFRFDELPQVLNILRGEMSWIGPRPESLPLSEWYERQIPFYSYRHIVRPGITGWAQVQQGYAARVEAVTGKLHYDFYYIKHFSPWLDVLIAARTIRTVLSGFGAR